mgnify:FL=1|jgi:hypothetical protein
MLVNFLTCTLKQRAVQGIVCRQQQLTCPSKRALKLLLDLRFARALSLVLRSPGVPDLGARGLSDVRSLNGTRGVRLSNPP